MMSPAAKTPRNHEQNPLNEPLEIRLNLSMVQAMENDQ
jgi:hypothetical protein